MFKSPNHILFESKGGEGDIILKGSVKADRIEATSLSAPEITAITAQIDEMRARIHALTLVPSLSDDSPTSAAVAAIETKISLEPLIAQIEDVRAQLQSADLPRILATIDELRTTRQSVSVQQLTRLQDQVSKLVGQFNTLQDRISVIEGRLVQSSSGSSASTSNPLVGSISSAVGSAAAQGAVHVLNRAAMKLEDMVSPGALYNLRRVSERGPVKYAW